MTLIEAPRGPDLRGRVLAGRYRLDRLLAAGGMADVYENCLVAGRRGRDHLLLIDLGLAKIVDGPPVLSLAPRSIPGTLVGSLTYLSPEQARAEALTTAADLYAVGVILFELLTRRPPFVGAHLQRIVDLLGSPPPSPRSLAPQAGIPEGIEAIVLRSLAKWPSDRFASAREFAAALVAELAAQGADPSNLRPHLCPTTHAGADEAQAALAAWTSFEYRRARRLAVTATRRSRAWAPLEILLADTPEE